MIRCNARTISGSRCQHRADHAGSHSLDGVFRSVEGYSCGYEWTDQSEASKADRYNLTMGT